MPNQSDPTQPVVNPPAPADTSPAIPDFQTSDIPPMPADNNQTPIANDQPESPPDLPPVISPPPKKKFGGGKIIATILGFLLLVGGVAGGVILTQQQQDIQEKAIDEGGTCPVGKTVSCSDDILCQTFCTFPDQWLFENGLRVECGHNSAGDQQYKCRDCACKIPSPTPSPTSEPLKCNSSCTTNDDCPSGFTCWAEEPGNPKVCRKSTCTWSANCVCPIPTPSYPPGVLGKCVGVKAYDSKWNPLALDTAAIKVGDKIYFAVKGEEGPGKYDQAKFMINGVEKSYTGATSEVGFNEKAGFYVEYTIQKTDVGKSINVKAKIHNTPVGWSEY